MKSGIDSTMHAAWVALSILGKALVVASVSIGSPSSSISESSLQDSSDPGGVSTHVDKKITMVVDTLKDILKSVEDDEEKETVIFDRYMKWCQSESTSISSDLTESKNELANAKVLSEEQVSSIDGLRDFIEKSEKDVEETKDVLAQTLALRKSENDKYTEDMETNSQALRQIEAAIKHINQIHQQGGFLQNGAMKKLQINQPGESSYVFGVMKGLQDKLKSNRAALEKIEAQRVIMYEDFVKTKSLSWKTMANTLADKRILLTETQSKEKGIKHKLHALTETVSKLVKDSRERARACRKTKQDWNIRKDDRKQEKAALTEAVRYLLQTEKEQATPAQDKTTQQTEKEEVAPVHVDTRQTEKEQAAPVQSDTRQIDKEQVAPVQAETKSKADDTLSSVVFEPSFVQLQNSKDVFHGSADDAIADRVSAAAKKRAFLAEVKQVQATIKDEAFKGVRSVVQKLITSHWQSQEEETQKKTYCEEEIASKQEGKDVTTDLVASIMADVEEKSSEVELLEDEMFKFQESIKRVQASVQEAGEVRKQEANAYHLGSKDRALAVKVLNQARAVIQAFYKKARGNLLQGAAAPVDDHAGDSPPPKPAKGAARKTSAGLGAASMTQAIADDIAKEEKDAAMNEQDAVQAYANLQQESEKTIEDRRQEIADRVTAKAKLQIQINSLKEKYAQADDELTATIKQLKALYSQCDELLEFYGQRKDARSFEVDQLHDVMDILAGAQTATRTGVAAVSSGSQSEAHAESDSSSVSQTEAKDESDDTGGSETEGKDQDESAISAESEAKDREDTSSDSQSESKDPDDNINSRLRS